MSPEKPSEEAVDGVLRDSKWQLCHSGRMSCIKHPRGVKLPTGRWGQVGAGRWELGSEDTQRSRRGSDLERSTPLVTDEYEAQRGWGKVSRSLNRPGKNLVLSPVLLHTTIHSLRGECVRTHTHTHTHPWCLVQGVEDIFPSLLS